MASEVMDEFSVERVEELIAGLGTGESWQRGGDYWDKQTVTAEGHTFIADCGNNIMTERVAEFIAAAPSIARQLVRVMKENEELKKRVAELRDDLDFEGVTTAD